MNNGNESDEGMLSYPSMDEGFERERSPGGLDTGEESSDFTPDDPEAGELKEALDLFENQEYEELAGVVERELTALQADPEEFGLFKFAKKHADDSPEWAAWIQKAVRNLYQQKRAYRLGEETSEE